MLEAERKERKRVQNRLNQRARRVRESERSAVKSHRQPYRVHRWRLDHEDSRSTYDLPSSIDKPCSYDLQAGSCKSLAQYKPDTQTNLPRFPTIKVQCPPNHPPEPTHSPSTDNLLHLIYYNVFRALHLNKEILSHTSISLSLPPDPTHHPKILTDADFPGYAVTLPATPDLPVSLTPTSSQMTLTHSTWISVLPCPKMRENLITWSSGFDHSDFVNDLVGDLVDGKKYSSFTLEAPPETTGSGQIMLSSGADDEVTTARNGLIVWGEPYRVENWEVTPGFLRKWAWAVQGCEELMSSSNRWRMVRGEEPLRVSSLGVGDG